MLEKISPLEAPTARAGTAISLPGRSLGPGTAETSGAQF